MKGKGVIESWNLNLGLNHRLTKNRILISKNIFSFNFQELSFLVLLSIGPCLEVTLYAILRM